MIHNDMSTKLTYISTAIIVSNNMNMLLIIGWKKITNKNLNRGLKVAKNYTIINIKS